MVPFDRRLSAEASFEEVAEELERLNADRSVSGVLLQLPVPDHLDGAALTAMISPDKDVDGLTPVNAGLLSLGRPGLRPATPLGVMELLADTGVELEGADAVVVGRSNLFGKPMAQLLLAHNATVTVCHSRTRELARGVLASGRAGRRGRPRAPGQAGLRQARGGRDRRRHEPADAARRPATRAVSSVTWTSPPSPRSPPRSPPCRAASAR